MSSYAFYKEKQTKTAKLTKQILWKVAPYGKAREKLRQEGSQLFAPFLTQNDFAVTSLQSPLDLLLLLS